MDACEKTTFLTPLLQITRRNISAISPSLRPWRNETRAASAAASTTRCAFLFFTVSSTLMGYDHEADDGQMERRENKLRRELRLV